MERHGKQYVSTLGMEPTNKVATQTIPLCVLDRRVTQHRRWPAGAPAGSAHVWRFIATCAHREVFVPTMRTGTLDAHFNEQPASDCLERNAVHAYPTIGPTRGVGAFSGIRVYTYQRL